MPIVIPGEPDVGGGGGPSGGGTPLIADPDLYDLWLGPLRFTWPRDVVEETLGDTLDAIGAALTPAERRPRPLSIPLLIEGHRGDSADPRAVGHRLRRQVRQLLENPDWLAAGLYLWWRADDELAGWVRVGGGKIREADPGVSFGVWELELETPYLVGRPATHRPGRRLDLADRRTGTVPRDTRGLIYSVAFADHDLAPEPLILPGAIANLASNAQHEVTTTPGPTPPGGLRLYSQSEGIDGEVVSYVADPATFPDEPSAYVTLDDAGAVRVWDLTPSVTYPPVQADYTTAGDLRPDDVYAWEAVYGAQLRSSSSPLAVDNGLIRLIWLGPETAGHALAFEWFDEDLGTFRREGRIGLGYAGTYSVAIVELTPERAVIEWRRGMRALRAIVQRGWKHARFEAYTAEAGGSIYLSYLSEAAAIAVGAGGGSEPWVITLAADGRTLYWAPCSDDELEDATTPGIYLRQREDAIAAQLGSPASSAADVAGWSLADARSVPVLLSRGGL